MKNIQKILFIALLLCIQAQLMAQYITLNGKQFINQAGNPFYPVVCNYVVELNYDPSYSNPTDYPLDDLSLTTFNLTPYCGYGSGASTNNSTYDDYSGSITGLFSKGLDRIKADFKKIHDMKFTTVRIIGLQCKKDESTNSGTFYAREYPDLATEFNIPVSSPYSSNHNLQYVVLPEINMLLDAAAYAEINVILVTGNGFLSHTSDQADDYAEYLTALSTNLADRTELLAYDLDNEAHYAWGGSTDDVWHTYRTLKKDEICNYVTEWRGAIKAHDTHHLITMGNTTVQDVRDYDPAVLNLDFNCFHLYPFIDMLHWMYPSTYTTVVGTAVRQRYLDVIEAEMSWIHNTSPIPWIVGEIGVPANSTTEGDNIDCSSAGVDVTAPPYVWGVYDKQTDFAQKTQQFTKNYEGSGYAWWEFQEEAWMTCDYGAGTYFGRHMGLLDPGNPTYYTGTASFSYSSDDFEKPLVDAAFTDNIVTTANASAAPPANYYNPFGGTFFTWSGYVLDHDDNPIKDAVIVGMNTGHHFIESDDHPVPDLPDEGAFEVYTFSDESGHFDLKAPVQRTNSTLWPYDYGKFDQIMISALGAVREDWSLDCNYCGAESAGYWFWYNDDPDNAASPTADYTINLYRKPGLYNGSGSVQGSLNATVTDVTVGSSDDKTYKARHTLTTDVDVLVEDGGIADFHAGAEVDLKPGFESQTGSETVVYIATVEPDCGIGSSSPLTHSSGGNSRKASVEQNDKSIEVHYALLHSGKISLLPNPANDKLYIVSDDKNESGEVEILNGLGSVIYHSSNANINRQMDISEFAPGLYSVHIASSNKNETFKLIINR